MIAPDSFIFMDPSQIAVAMDSAEVRSSGQGTVELANSSNQSSVDTVTAANQTSLFMTNSTAILGEMSANWRLLRPEAVAFQVQSFNL